MARINGPIQVWFRNDTTPTDAEGGYAGGDSTAAAIARVTEVAAEAATVAGRDAAGSYFVQGKNLYNPDDPDVMPGYTLSGANPVALSTYTLTGYIPVTAGATYTLSNPRNWAFYDISREYVTGSSGSESTSATTTLTAPAGAHYLRASFATSSYGTTFQVERGATRTDYEPYSLTLTGVEIPDNRPATTEPVTVTRAGTELTVTTDLDGRELTQVMNLAGSKNGAFNWHSTHLDGTQRHGITDSVTPLRTQMGTIGANHGFAQVRSFTNPDSKSAADLGSQWSDGATTYTLLSIEDTGRLVLGGPASVDSSGRVVTSVVDPAADLTHVSGATNTATIPLAGMQAAQLYPSVGRVRVAATLDGASLPEGAASGRVLRVVESYEILDYADLVAKAQANVGTSYTDLAVVGSVRMSILYEMRAPGAWMISTTVAALESTLLNACGFVQAEALSLHNGGAQYRWVPGVLPVGGHDFHAGVDLETYATSNVVTDADLMDPTKPPTWALDVTWSGSGADVLGFAIGYVPDKSDGSWASRVATGPSNYWDLRSSKKNYPTALSGVALAPGERVSVQAFRAYLTPINPFESQHVTVEDTQAVYAFARARDASGLPMPLPEQLGRGITPLAEQGLTIAPGVIDADGITVTGDGAAIAKLT